MYLYHLKEGMFLVRGAYKSESTNRAELVINILFNRTAIPVNDCMDG